MTNNQENLSKSMKSQIFFKLGCWLNDLSENHSEEETQKISEHFK